MSPRQQKGKRAAPGKRSASGTWRKARAGLRGPGPRLPLAVFAALFLLLFAGFAIAQGIGRPDAEGDTVVVVEDAPGDGVDTITQEEFDQALESAAAQNRLPRVPPEDSEQYPEVAQFALGDLLDTVWIQGEAEEQGIDVSERQIDDQLEQIRIDNNLRSDKAFAAFLKESGFTPEDARLRVELQLLSNKLQQAITQEKPKISNEQVEDYYEGAKSQYELPETRDIRLVLNRNRSKVEQAKTKLEADSSPAAWKRIAQKFSTDPASQANGGQRPGLTEGLLEDPLNGEVFSAQKGELVGPVRTPLGFYVFQVDKISPARTQDLKEVQGQIRRQLSQQEQQEAFSEFVEDYGGKWQSRTICSSDLFFIGDGPTGPGALERCSNYTGSGHPANAPAGCYEENPKGGLPPACPAPVLQLTPALPGTVNALSPQGLRLPQRPRPVGLPEPTEQPQLPGALPGIPPGATP